MSTVVAPFRIPPGMLGPPAPLHGIAANDDAHELGGGVGICVQSETEHEHCTDSPPRKQPANETRSEAGGARRTKRRSDSEEVIHADDLPSGLVFAMKTLNTKSVGGARASDRVLLVCAQHNLRKDNAHHRHRKNQIDPARTANNEVLRGPNDPVAVAAAAHAILDQHGIIVDRSDRIMGIEFVMQPPDGHDVPAFYGQCLAWVDARYGREHVASAVVHRDQKRPHLHVLVCPMLDGRLDGAALTSGQNRLHLQRMSFMAHMRESLGLRPDRDSGVAKRPKPKSMQEIFTSAGKGPKSRAMAAKRDADLLARQPPGPVEAVQPPSPANVLAQRPPGPDLLLRSLQRIAELHREGVAAGVFLKPLVPAPTPLRSCAQEECGG